MTSLSRLWFALPPAPGEPIGRMLEGLAQRPLAALLTEPDEAHRRLAEVLVSRGAPRPLAVESPGTADLDLLAAGHPDLEIAVLGGPGLLLQALALALGLPTVSLATILPRPGSLSAFHWPTGRDPSSRPELIGLDLDWFPPWHSGQPRPRFPGGPGVAGSARR
jgi:hypothetical protein